MWTECYPTFITFANEFSQHFLTASSSESDPNIINLNYQPSSKGGFEIKKNLIFIRRIENDFLS